LAAVIKRGKAGTDIFGLRLQRHSFGYFMEQLRTAYPSASCDTDCIEPLRVCYVALAADPLAVTASVLSSLGASNKGLKGLPLPVAKLADATNQDWAGRYLAETNG